MIRPLLTAVALFAAVASPSRAEEAKPAELKVGAFTFKVAAPWEARKEKKAMSAGGFTLPGKDGAAPIEADFYHFGAGQGGGVEPNLQRWQKQFLPDTQGNPAPMTREEITVGGQKALLVTITGTFLSGPAMSPKKTPMRDYAMVGAILQSPEGDVFLKVTGPEAATLAQKDSIKQIITAALTK
ncbi:MAG: hypothetical protein EOP86_00700 [Verrucomicrobiaceae bacterium]|nr:MAG: hypothetical protein EOP86_00700 [Verrucomicrobiaceae bacterium]